MVRVVQEAGGYWSFENPIDSLVWEMRCVRPLFKYENVFEVDLDQCSYGGPAKKATKVLTNANWLSALRRRCCDAPPHRHVVLRGKVIDLREGSGKKMVWRTTLAAEYPHAMVNKMANLFR